MKTTFFVTILLALAALSPAPRAEAGIDLDFRAELHWRADYHDEIDAAVILYEYSDYRGRRLVIYPDEQLDDFYDYEWGFRVRSVQVIGPVHIILYDESGLWGHQLDVYHNIADLGEYRMRLNPYSTFRWHRRARSAYVSFNPVGFDIRLNLGRSILPRIYCARPIAPRYYRPAATYHYHNPTPPYYDRGYRQNTHTRPSVTPPPPNRIPGTVRGQAAPPTARPGYTPGRPPTTVPGNRPGAAENRPTPGQSRPAQGTVPRTERPSNPPSRQNPGQAPSQSQTRPERTAPPNAPPSAPPTTVPGRTAPPPQATTPVRTPPPQATTQRSGSRPTSTTRPRGAPNSRPPAAPPSRSAPRSAPPPPPRRN